MAVLAYRLRLQQDKDMKLTSQNTNLVAYSLMCLCVFEIPVTLHFDL